MKECDMQLWWTFDNVIQVQKNKACGFIGPQNKENIMSVAMGTMPCKSQRRHCKGLGAPVALISLDSIQNNASKNEQNKKRNQKQTVITYLCHALKNQYFLDGFHYGADCIMYNGLSEKDHGTHLFMSYKLPETIPCINLVTMVRLASDVKKKLVLIFIKDTRIELYQSHIERSNNEIQCACVERLL